MSSRERDILRQVAQERSNLEIAAELGMTEGTVKNYLSVTFKKLQVTDRQTAARVATEAGWL